MFETDKFAVFIFYGRLGPTKSLFSLLQDNIAALKCANKRMFFEEFR